jgi:hypothetical protein
VLTRRRTVSNLARGGEVVFGFALVGSLEQIADVRVRRRRDRRPLAVDEVLINAIRADERGTRAHFRFAGLFEKLDE